MSDRTVDVLIICAMEEESAPFLEAMESRTEIRLLPSGYRGPATFHEGSLYGHSAAVVTSGIGMTNAAIAATAALVALSPRLVIVAGTTGGLGKDVSLDEVMLATSAHYHDADATGFGYAPGQIPRMPARYEAHPATVAAIEQAALDSGLRPRRGEVASSNSFVMADQVAAVRELFPNTVAVDMETAAVAQVCWTLDCPWVSVRAVSDLCDAGEFDDRAPDAYKTSFAAASAFLKSQDVPATS